MVRASDRMTLQEIQDLTDAQLNHQLALAHGYVFAGPFRGHQMYHPPQERTRVVECPDYVGDWNLLIPLVLTHALLGTCMAYLRSARDEGEQARRGLCELALRALQECDGPTRGIDAPAVL